MTLKNKLYLLCVLLHTLLLIAAWQFSPDPGWAFMAVEGALIVSLLLFIFMIRKVLEPIEQLELFKDILQEQDYTARFPDAKNSELDELVSLFNQMLNQLYQERLKLGDRKGMLQQLMDALPGAVIVFDFEHRISQINPGARTLLETDEAKVKGRALNELTHPIVTKLAQLPLNESVVVSAQMGKRYRCQRNVFRDRGFDREFIIVQEVTRELQSSEKNTYEKLIRLMSHEVNNTMAATSSLLKSCLHYADQIDEQEREDYRDAMTLVIERVDNLSQFMQGFANMVRLPQPSLETCNLLHMLLATKRLFEVKLAERNIEFVLPEFAAEQAQVSVDRNQLEQVLINVVKNAMEAIGNDGQITVELNRIGSTLTLKINDTGPGLSETFQQDLFTPFFTTKDEGQGLGLMLVREILGAHGFEFALYNGAEHGACFEIRF